MEYAKRVHSVERIVRAQNPFTTKGGKRDRKESERVRKSKEKEMTIKRGRWLQTRGSPVWPAESLTLPQKIQKYKAPKTSTHSLKLT